MLLVEKVNPAEAMSTWANTIEKSTGITDKGKLTWMSEYCAYHKIAESKGMVDYGDLLLESIRNTVNLNPGMNVPGMGPVAFPGNPGTATSFHNASRGSGDNPLSLLPLAMQVAGQTPALDLVPVVPLGGPFGMLTYLDFPYAGGNLATPSVVNGAFLQNPGMGGADGKVAPLMIKSDINWDMGTNLVPEPNDVFYASHGDLTPYKFTYIGKSRIDGYSIFKVEAARDASAKNMLTATFIAGLMQDITLADIFKEGSEWKLYEADTSGDISGAVTEELVKSAELVMALEDHVTAFSGRGFKAKDVTSHEPYLREEGESTPDNLIGLKLFNKSIKAGTLQVAAAVTREQIQDLKQYGIDAIGQVEAVLTNELTQGINKHILDRLFRLGNTNAKQIWDIDGTNLSLYLGKPAGTDPATSNLLLGLPMNSDDISDQFSIPTTKSHIAGAEVMGTLQRRILSRILAASNLINIRGRRGAANFAVTNGQVATALQDIAGFVAYPLSNTVNQTPGALYPIGSVAGVAIYVDGGMPWTDTRVLIGRKGDGNSPGLIFMPYLMAESVSTIAEGTMAPKISIKSRYQLVEAGFHPQTMYYTLSVKFGDGLTMI